MGYLSGRPNSNDMPREHDHIGYRLMGKKCPEYCTVCYPPHTPSEHEVTIISEKGIGHGVVEGNSIRVTDPEK